MEAFSDFDNNLHPKFEGCQASQVMMANEPTDEYCLS
jgi:hypothetical protein